MYDSTQFFLEQGLYAQAVERARALRLSESAAWGVDLGPLAAVLAGDLAEVDAWAELAETSQTSGQLALGLRDAARGQYAEAARRLRAMDKEHLWYDLSWTAHPKPGLKLPEAAQPAFERFLETFTRAYGDADMKALGESVDTFAAELEKLH
jgi:hypothetical protein